MVMRDVWEEYLEWEHLLSKGWNHVDKVGYLQKAKGGRDSQITICIATFSGSLTAVRTMHANKSDGVFRFSRGQHLTHATSGNAWSACCNPMMHGLILS